jgi:hypothetical protein
VKTCGFQKALSENNQRSRTGCSALIYSAGSSSRATETGAPPLRGLYLEAIRPKEKRMGAIRIIATVIMMILFINIVTRLIMGEIKVAAWKKGTITNDDGIRLRLRSAQSLRLSLGVLLVAMAVFLFSE